MTRPLTVVQLLPALDAGGVERSTLEIAAALLDAGHRAIVVSAGGRMLPALQAIGAEHVPLPIGRKSLLTLRHVPALRRLFRDSRADIVHARSRLPAWLAVAALRGMKKDRPRFITTMHGLNSPGRYSGVMLRGERVICVSGSVRAHALRHYPGIDPTRLTVIPRGVDPSAFVADAAPDPGWRARFLARYPQLAGERLLLMPARGTRLKGHTHALDLLASLRADGVDARLLLAGADQPGRERYLAELRARADTLGLREVVACTVPLAEMRELYALSDLVLQLSDKPESFGRTVIEALCSGRAVVGWDHGGVGELLHELFPDGAVALADADALAQRAKSLLAATRPSIRLPDRYTLARMQADTLAVYADLVARSS
ncbi:MAG TPA: glycosyltransferase [Xanthomonadaceae bacterium]|nr:glycosyltransferase [Xanthomonadaceae bacterium]